MKRVSDCQKKARLAAMGVDYERLTAAAIVTASNFTGVAALLDELFDHTDRDFETTLSKML